MRASIAFPSGIGPALAVAGVLLAATSTFRASDSESVQGPFREAASVADMPGLGVGEWLPDIAFIDVDGRPGRLSDFAAGKALVIAMHDIGCPVAQRYGPTLSRLEEEYGRRGVSFLHLDINPADDAPAVRKDLVSRNLAGRSVADPSAALAVWLQPRTTTEVFVLDTARTVVYRGAIDDQYGIGFNRPAARETWLRDALDAVLAGRAVEVELTRATGCVVTASAKKKSEPVTWHNRISRIVQRNCETCHRPGGAAPFSLQDHDKARGYASMIEFVLENRIMPPWFADEGSGPWANARQLSARDRRDLLAWTAAGAPVGDPADAPQPLVWESGWQIGTPDAVVEIPEPIDVPAEGVIDYQYVYVKTDFPEDRWVRKMEIRPTAPQVTHHVLVFIEEPGRKQGRERQEGDPPFQGGLAGYFASTVPGQQPTVFADGTGKKLPKGAWLKFQIHYTTNGKPAVDRSRIGLVFADEPPRHEVQTTAAFDTEFTIPPGVAGHEVTGDYAFPADALLLSFFPHMHTRGKAFRYDLIFADGTTRELLPIARYDFNWQLIYRLQEPVRVPAGTRLRATGWFDNSDGNPANPDPTVEVTFGEQTFDEMMIGYVDWIEAPAAPPVASERQEEAR